MSSGKWDLFRNFARKTRKVKMKIGFDNEKYLRIQSEHIRERIAQFDGKLYLELG